MYVEQKKKDGRSFPSIHLEFYVLGSYIYQYGYKSIEHGKTTVPIFIFKSLSHVKIFFREHENTNFSRNMDNHLMEILRVSLLTTARIGKFLPKSRIIGLQRV